jgi:protein-S-isoprenylcysteine O-methyltransferase Ste14
MHTLVDSIETVLRWLGAIAGLGTLAYAIYKTLLAQKQPTGKQTGAADQLLRTRTLIIATVLFLILAYALWKPLPVLLPWPIRILFVLAGGGVLFSSLLLYLWGLRTLGTNFNASSGFGVRLHQAHQLITHGPYAYIRHPIYLAVILACWGGLLLYRTWTMLIFAVIMLGLIYRANNEEEALAQAFGRVFEDYKHRVPGWIPSIESLRRKNVSNKF